MHKTISNMNESRKIKLDPVKVAARKRRQDFVRDAKRLKISQTGR
jgi:hypothetical protein